MPRADEAYRRYSAMTERIRLGCIGVGSRGRHLLEAASLHPAVEIAAICDTDPENLAACADMLAQKLHIQGVKCFSSAEDMLAADIDAVIVATHIAKHTEMAILALDHGKHVLSEIPTVGSYADAEALLAAVRAHPELNYMAGENCCYWHFIREWKKLYDSGELGQALFCESDYIHPWHTMERPDGRPTWRTYMPSIHYVTHNLGPLLYILGDEPAEVSGFVPDINPLSDRHPAPTDGVAIVKTKKGAVIKIYIGFGSTHRGGHNFIIYGSRGSLENGRLGPLDTRHTYAYLPTNPDPYSEIELPIGLAAPGASDFGHGGADTMMTAEFINSILEKRPPELSAEYGVMVSLPGLMADESSKNGGAPIRMADRISL